MTDTPDAGEKPRENRPRKTSRGGPKRSRTSSKPKVALPGLERSIVLVGLMGAGKTTVGRRLARALGWAFVDADEAIEDAADMKVAEIFELFGEAYFRDGERRVIARLLNDQRTVIATGGGAFMNDETRALIREKGLSIWLKADLDVLMDRVSRRDTRPLLRVSDPRKVMETLVDARYPIYAQADLTVVSDKGPHSRTVEVLVETLKQYTNARTPDAQAPAQTSAHSAAPKTQTKAGKSRKRPGKRRRGKGARK